MSINNCLLDKRRFWQGFSSENQLKSHRGFRTPPPLAASCKRLYRMRPSSELGGYLHECGAHPITFLDEGVRDCDDCRQDEIESSSRTRNRLRGRTPMVSKPVSVESTDVLAFGGMKHDRSSASELDRGIFIIWSQRRQGRLNLGWAPIRR
jgi:hypothetical protein